MTAIAILALALGLAPPVSALPKSMAFQGVYREGPAPFTGSKSMTFSFTDVNGALIAAPGNPFIAGAVAISSGLFQVSIPVDAAFPWNKTSPYLKVAIGGVDVPGLEPIAAQPYALVSAQAQGIALPLPTVLTVSTPVYVSAGARVGVGTNSPQATLHVKGSLYLKDPTISVRGTPMGLVPPNALVYFNRPSCPSGWGDFSAGAGRYIVGLPEDGTPEGVVGIAMGPGEARVSGEHTHPVTHTHTVATGNAFGGTTAIKRGFFRREEGARPTTFAMTDFDTMQAGTADTPAPYVVLRLCERHSGEPSYPDPLVAAPAAVPPLNYQGFYKEGAPPVPFSGSKSMTFTLTDSEGTTLAAAGNPATATVAVSSGLFRAALPAPALPWGTVSPYVKISVEGAALSPIEKISAVPYALQAASAEGLQAQDRAQGVFVSTSIFINGSLVVKEGSPPNATLAPVHIDGRLRIDSSTVSVYGENMYMLSSGTLMYVKGVTCPQGWEEYLPMRGRYALGLPDGGTRLESVGRGLSDLEERAAGAHSHLLAGSHSHLILIGQEDGTVQNTGYLGSESVGDSQLMEQHTEQSSPAGYDVTPAPYIQLLMCRRL